MTKSLRANRKRRPGFTIVELLVAIFVIGILAGISVVSYNGIQLRAQNLRRQDDMKAVEAQLETYAIRNGGTYPATTANPAANWKTVDVRTDANCFNGSAQTDWIPEMTSLPQSFPNTGSATGVDGNPGCYLYASNGEQYVLSAWNMLADPQAEPPLYRRLGFRSFQTSTSTQFYSCNANVIGGANGSSYDITQDYYKHSYVISNITDCDETPPPGA
ncbi:type II secretion system protein [Candidatus Saccharibacteria bacterium]|nr:type II secretion system protein [Candidatus Saccharibacteria bacterium]